jgi:hypothetical protein
MCVCVCVCKCKYICVYVYIWSFLDTEMTYYVRRFTNAKAPVLRREFVASNCNTTITTTTTTNNNNNIIPYLLTRLITEEVCTLNLNNESSYSLLQTCAEATGP